MSEGFGVVSVRLQDRANAIEIDTTSLIVEEKEAYVSVTRSGYIKQSRSFSASTLGDGQA